MGWCQTHKFNSLWPSNAIWWHGTGSTLAEVMACCLTAPSHYLNWCWLLSSEVQWQSITWGQIHKRYVSHQLLNLNWKLLIWNFYQISLESLHICVTKLTIIGSDNGLLPDHRQAIIWTNADLLLNGPLETSFDEIGIKIWTFSFKKMPLKMSSAKSRPFCHGLNVLTVM